MNCCTCNETVGYRFHPTDKELIDHYLWNKALGRDSAVQAIGEIYGDLCDWEPGQLSWFSARSNDQTWYLFSRRNSSKRVKRTTKLGYWKLTGRNRNIKANVGIGIKKTLVFYEGRAKGKWTPWVIHEYTLPDTIPNPKGFFLCKLKRKDEEKPGISTGEDGQPSIVADDNNFDNSLGMPLDELLAILGQTNGTDEAEDEVAFAQEQLCCNATSFLYNPDDVLEGVRYQSSTNEQMHKEHVSSTLQSQLHEEHMTSFNDLSFLCGFNGNLSKIQHQSSTNEQMHEEHVSSTLQSQLHADHVTSFDDLSFLCGFNGNLGEIQHQSSTNEQMHEEHVFSTLQSQLHEQHMTSFDVLSFLYGSNGNLGESSTNEQSHEIQHHSFDDGRNARFVGSDSYDLPVDRYLPIESSRKRLRIDDGGLNDFTETEVSQERYGHPVGPSSTFVHPDSSVVLEMSSVEASNAVFNLHSSGKRLDMLQEKWPPQG